MPTTLPSPQAPIEYPESDGKPMADSTIQSRWIRRLLGNISAMYRQDEQVFVAGDLLWYPAEGFPQIVSAPDVMVVFGRPKGDRRSYKQWEEEDIGPQVVFEVLSHHNTYIEMEKKLDWYEDHGVEEYYVYDPETNSLRAYVRDGSVLRVRRPVDGFISPRLKIRFDLSGEELVVYRPDGRPFTTFEELEQRAEAAETRAARLAELSRKARRGQASAEELAELDRLEEATAP